MHLVQNWILEEKSLHKVCFGREGESPRPSSHLLVMPLWPPYFMLGKSPPLCSWFPHSPHSTSHVLARRLIYYLLYIFFLVCLCLSKSPLAISYSHKLASVWTEGKPILILTKPFQKINTAEHQQSTAYMLSRTWIPFSSCIHSKGNLIYWQKWIIVNLLTISDSSRGQHRSNLPRPSIFYFILKGI